ncbi:MAG: methyltransferase domain-containing protein [Actinomycetota bacterium]
MNESHYDRVGDLVTAIMNGLGNPDVVSIDDLAPVDEFHLGGAAATTEVIRALEVGPSDRVLDVGCGLGGPARRIATVTGAHVTGVDVTSAFVATAAHLSGRVGLREKTTFHVGDVAALEFSRSFDAATLVHVGMNIADKSGFFATIHDLLVPGGRFVIYDLMAIGPVDDLAYPLPFAADASGAFLASPDEYRAALYAAGFVTSEPTDLTQLSLDAAAATRVAGAPSVSLATVMGPDFGTMFRNLGAALQEEILAPTLLVATS